MPLSLRTLRIRKQIAQEPVKCFKKDLIADKEYQTTILNHEKNSEVFFDLVPVSGTKYEGWKGTMGGSRPIWAGRSVREGPV
jgi:hypothetical protein